MPTGNTSLAIVDGHFEPPEYRPIAPPSFGRQPADISPIFSATPRGAELLGADGSGPAAEACRDLVLGTMTVLLGEALTLARRLGLDAEDALDIAADAAADALRCSRRGAGPTAGETVSTAEILSRLSAAQAAAARAGTSLPVAATAQEIYALFARVGGAAKPFTSVAGMLGGSNGGRLMA